MRRLVATPDVVVLSRKVADLKHHFDAVPMTDPMLKATIGAQMNAWALVLALMVAEQVVGDGPAIERTDASRSARDVPQAAAARVRGQQGRAVVRLYIASAWSRAEWIDTVLRGAIERAGATIVSSWHRAPYVSADPFSSLPKAQRQAVYRTNCDELASADAALVILDEVMPDGARPRQTYAELARAVILGHDVIAVGPPFPPECEAPNVLPLYSIADAVREVERLALERSRRSVTQPAPECERVYVIGNDGHEADDGVPVKCDRPARDGRMCAECATMEAT